MRSAPSHRTGRFVVAVACAIATVAPTPASDLSASPPESIAGPVEDPAGPALVLRPVATIPSPTAEEDGRFGYSLAVDGDTAVVGISGASYVLQRNQGGAEAWGVVAVLPVGGTTHAISGDTVAVGFPRHRDGEVHIYERNAGGADVWGEVAVLRGPNFRFTQWGSTIALDGDTLVNSAWGIGQAYVHERNAGGPDGWGLTASLNSPFIGDPGAGAFGFDVDVSGDTIVVGGSTVSVFARSATAPHSWMHVADPVGVGEFSEVGFVTVAIDGDTVVAGASFADTPFENTGAARVYRRNAGGPDAWGEVARLSQRDGVAGSGFGHDVVVDGDRVIVSSLTQDLGGDDVAAAHVFARNAGGADAWGQVARVTLPAGSTLDTSQRGIASSGELLFVGAPYEDDTAIDSGAVHVHALEGCDWVDVASPGAAGGGDDARYGTSVALRDDTLVVGARLDDTAAADAGAVYVFARNAGGADTWDLVTTLLADDAAAGDHFGESVTIDDGTIVVGATDADHMGISSGAAYVFERNAGGADAWSQTTKLVAADAANGKAFGVSVAKHGATILVGASYDDDARGAVYGFRRDVTVPGGWRPVDKLTASDGAADDMFGGAVAVQGHTAIVGAEFHDGVAAASGAAYVFAYDPIAEDWAEVRKLEAADAGAADQFGGAVALDGATAVVGASRDAQVGPLTGAAYVFGRNVGGADAWGQVQKLQAADLASFSLFGYAVAVAGPRIVVGAQWDPAGGAEAGAVHVFERNAGGADGWGPVDRVVAADVAEFDGFGRSVAIDGSTFAAGAPGHADAGGAWIFAFAGCPCGDGILVDGEECDDGNTTDIDGCSSVCTVEPCEDADGDGFGHRGRATCPAGTDRDCDDSDGSVYPGADETCDGIATDCNSPIWPDLSDDERDADHDGIALCEGDCNDFRATVYPGAPEICDLRNNDCNDPDWPDPPPDEVDADGDGYALCNRECDDTDPTVRPGGSFLCDGINNNCDDINWPELRPNETDDDGDGFWECQGDCDDTNPAVSPAQSEICNGVDDDCNDLIDDDGTAEDADADGLPGACDNCVLVFNASQADRDDDGEGDACDPDDGTIHLRLGSSGSVAWDAETGFVAWNLYRGDLAVLQASGLYTQPPESNPLAGRECGGSATLIDDATVPAAGAVAFYLVAGVTDGGAEGDLGFDSAGAPRPNASPCP